MLAPFIKWAGGKEKEIKMFNHLFPQEVRDYYEPFVGGGAVSLYFEGNNFRNILINDRSDELINIYRCISESNVHFFEYIQGMHTAWLALESICVNNSEDLVRMYTSYRQEEITQRTLRDVVFQFIFHHNLEFNNMFVADFNVMLEEFNHQLNRSLVNKMKRMKDLEAVHGMLNDRDVINNIETAFKSAYYTHYRYIYNHRNELGLTIPVASAIFYFIREYCYSSMFRYNSHGHFNVPYGGMAYNRKDFQKKINYIQSERLINYLSGMNIQCSDFEDFINNYPPGQGDFIFLDPPYDTEFSTYMENEFHANDQRRLAEFLYNTPANFMLVIKASPLIRELYEGRGLRIEEFDKKYQVNFKNRNNRDVEHLIIMNY